MLRTMCAFLVLAGVSCGSAGAQVKLRDLKGHWSLFVFADAQEALLPLRDVERQADTISLTIYGICRDAAPTLRSFAEREHLQSLLHAPELLQLLRHSVRGARRSGTRISGRAGSAGGRPSRTRRRRPCASPPASDPPSCATRTRA
jgi:hypothetical protein